MSAVMDYPLTRQGVRDLDHPIRRNEGTVTVGQTERTASMTEGPRGHIEDGVNVGNPERTASKIAGAILAGIGMTKGGLKGLLLMALGGALAYRGYSGHCAAYAAAGINTAK
jgi:uncharacterized membrane protein